MARTLTARSQAGWNPVSAGLLPVSAAMMALTESGPGRPSVDEALFPWLKGKGWAIAQLLAGVAGSYLVTERFTEHEEAPAEGDAELPGDPAAPRRERFTREGAEAPASAR